MPGALSIGEYHVRYADTKRAEYWFGEVRFKSVPTWLHSLLQGLLVQIFTDAGYASGSELDLRIDPQWEPKPDVAASLWIEEPYPTQPIDIAAEILSPNDKPEQVEEKCAQYARIGIGRIFVFNPIARTASEWVAEGFTPIESIDFDNGASSVPLPEIWKELDRRVALGKQRRS